MGKNKKLIGLILVALVLVGGTFLYLKRGTLWPKKEKVIVFPPNPQKGDYGYKDPNTTVTIGTENTYKGSYEKIENGNIFIKSGSSITKYPLASKEVVLSCTTQDLAKANELNYDLIKDVKILDPSAIAGLIPKGETVVVFAAKVDGVLQVHTVNMDASKCPH